MSSNKLRPVSSARANTNLAAFCGPSPIHHCAEWTRVTIIVIPFSEIPTLKIIEKHRRRVTDDADVVDIFVAQPYSRRLSGRDESKAAQEKAESQVDMLHGGHQLRK